MNPNSNTVRELLWDNPMLLEATRSVRRFFRAGMSGEGSAASSALNRFMLCALFLLYGFTIVGLVNSKEDISQVILLFQITILTLLVPGSLYGAVAVEREKQTYDALIMTRLTPAQIIYGKYSWRVVLILIVMALFAPLLILTHFQQHRNFGTELAVSQVLWAELGTFTWSLLVGAVTLWVSARSKKGITALLISFGLLALFLAGVPAIASLIDGATPYTQGDKPAGLYVCGLLINANPFFQLITLGSSLSGVGASWIRFWMHPDVPFWSVVFYVSATAAFLSGAVKTVRGLELPTLDTTRRGKRGK